MASLAVDNLHFGFEREKASLFAGLYLNVEPGGVYLIVGDNGSGKTTLGKLVTGVLRPHFGSVLIANKDVHSLKRRERPRYGMYMGQVSYLEFFSSSLAEEIAFAKRLAKFQGDWRNAYEDFSLTTNFDASPLDLTRTEMWRFQLFLFAIIYNPIVLFIDEVVAPTNSVQLKVLNKVLRRRALTNVVTLLAYQRRLNLDGAKVGQLKAGTLNDP